MKRFLFASLFILLSTASFAGDGYKLTIKFSDLKDSLVYLAHYYAKPLPTLYKQDSGRIDKNGVLVLQSKEKVLGGIYIILVQGNQRYFEVLLNNGDNMNITANSEKLPQSIKITGSPENERFNKYSNYLIDFGARGKKLEDELKAAKTKADSDAVYAKGKDMSKELIDYRMNYIKEYPNSLLAKIFNAIRTPQVPEGTHYLPDGKVDSNFAYNYYKSHFWDYFDFTDDRLIHTPVYDQKLDEYFNKLLIPTPDSVEKEADILLAKTRGRTELFKYTLHWITNWAQNSKIMGLDEVFVYLVENYHMKGDAYWMDHETLNKYIDRARKVAPNVIGNVAPELKMKDVKGVEHSLSELKAKYTLLIFWSPDCGHCMTEIPKMDSVYKAVLKKKGVKVYAVRTEGDEAKWQDFIKKNPGMEEWVNVWDPEHHSDYQSQYDVYGTPTIYLLDEKKIIRGKRLDYENIITLLDILENKEKKAAK
ncbi:MAG: hypothetical protein BGO70_10165 [Bacteroidetes bacterium 43-93]|nr:redoxin domain-containing protein [Bacteroidota bacterium]OJX00520.1 MAG: hypothetical protein BGO70_10165 [Bacteroidetes bacterium 43-93]